MKSAHSISRRSLLGALAAASIPMGHANAAQAATKHSPLASRRLISITLDGGNDGLNTVVPIKDPLYRRLRPVIGLPEAKCLPIGSGLALHPSMVQMRAMYEAGEMAIVQDVGYPDHNLSHFYSTDVWNAGETDRSRMDLGWYGRSLTDNHALFLAQDFDAQAMLFSNAASLHMGPGVRAFPAALIPRGDVLEPPMVPVVSSGSSSLVRLLAEAPQERRDMTERIARRLAGHPVPLADLNEDEFLRQVQLAIFTLARDIKVPLLRLEQGSYDFHTRQLPRQAERLATLDTALSRLRTALRSEGLWNSTVIFVHSEFGRRVAQNGYDGTDHGTAGPSFLFGGAVAGGLYGQQPLLDRLDSHGNVYFGTDFRRLYATVLQNLWQLPVNRPAAAGHLPLDIRMA